MSNVPAVMPQYAAIRKLEAMIPALLEPLDAEKHTYHHFCKGIYFRQLNLPAGTVLVGKMHKEENLFLLLHGEMTVTTDEGVIRIKAPFMSVSKPGTKRAGFAHTDCVVANIHSNPDDEQDTVLLEERYIIPEEPLALPDHLTKLALERKTT
jgi:hypothetical protein